MAYRDYGVANACCIGTFGNFATITKALASPQAVSGAVFYLYPGTYTENFTLPSGIMLVALGDCSLAPTVTIIGTVTYNGPGSATIWGCRLQTNGSYCLSYGGSGISNLFIEQCFINCTNFDGINFTNSNANSLLQIYRSSGDTTTSGIRIYNISSPGDFVTKYTNFENSGNSLTASTSSAGVTQHTFLTSHQLITTTGSATIYIISSDIDMTTFTNTNNATCVAANGSGQGLIVKSYLNSNNADTITIGGGNALSVQDLCLSSSSGRVLSGPGTAILGTINCAFTNGISVGTRSLQGTCISPRFITAGPTGVNELESGTTLQIDSGATVQVQNGAVLNINAGANIDVPLTGLLMGNGVNNPVTAVAYNPSGFPWTTVTTATQTLATNHGYVTDHTNVTYTLPATANLGDTILIVGQLGITTIAQNAGQQILMSSGSSTVGVSGSVAGTNVGDCITLICITAGASTVYRSNNFVGSWTIT